jgi:hypothetical protein
MAARGSVFHGRWHNLPVEDGGSTACYRGAHAVIVSHLDTSYRAAAQRRQSSPPEEGVIASVALLSDPVWQNFLSGRVQNLRDPGRASGSPLGVSPSIARAA